jgi:hypothetical protein
MPIDNYTFFHNFANKIKAFSFVFQNANRLILNAVWRKGKSRPTTSLTLTMCRSTLILFYKESESAFVKDELAENTACSFQQHFRYISFCINILHQSVPLSTVSYIEILPTQQKVD